MGDPRSIAAELRDERVVELLEEALGAAAEGLAILDADGTVVLANHAATAVLGREHDALRGVRLATVVDGLGANGDAAEEHAARARRPDGTVVELGVRVVKLPADGLVAVGIREPGSLGADDGRLAEITEHDPLTGLLNRRRFEADAERELARAKRYGGGLLVLGLDDFASVNESAGYRSGDELLREVAALMSARIRETDVAARLGGDEFAIVLTEVSVESARAIGEDLVGLIASHRFELDGETVRVGASVGVIGLGEEDGPADVAEAVGWAELAMRRAKAMGGGRALAFQGSLLPEGEQPRSWNERIREALDSDSFVPYFQPILELASGSVSTWEVLIRMRGEGEELIEPEAFVPTAERSGLIGELDLWVIRNAIGAMRAHAERPGLSLELNLSARSIGDPEMLTAIREEIISSEVDPRRLVFEVTETAAIANLDQAARFGHDLLELGCGFALDDFGTGFASFYYLKRLPLTHLKIDGDFIRGLTASPVDQLVVKAIVEIAGGMGLRTIAEYVEDAPTLELLREFGVDYCQGYEVGPPRAPQPPDLVPPPFDPAAG